MAKRTLLNLKEVRGRLAADAPVIVAPDGREFPVGVIPLDSYLAILDLQQLAEDLRAAKETTGAEDVTGQRALLTTARDLVTLFLPGFPAGSLALEELFQVIGAVQSANTPEGDKREAAGDAPVGESTGAS